MSCVVFIPLTHGQVTVVDFADFERVRGYTWYTVAKGGRKYARRSRSDGPAVYLHHEVMGKRQGLHLDHVDGDGLNNCRLNLRFLTPALNQANRSRLNRNNTSGFRGVTFSAHRKIFIAQIAVGRKGIFLGHFTCPVEAARVRDMAAKKYFGSAAALNFP